MGDPHRPSRDEADIWDLPSLAEDEDDIEIPEGDLTEPVLKREADPETLRRRKRRRALRAVLKLLMVLIIIGCALGAGAYAIYDHYAVYYATHFYEGTRINGKDVSFRTVDVIKRSIESDVAKYTLTVEEKDGVSETLSAEDVGWHYVDDGKVDAFMASQDAEHWYRHFRKGQDFSLQAGTAYDTEKALAAIRGLNCFRDEYVTDPVDAALIENAEGTYEVSAEIEGNRLDSGKAEAAILAALDGARERVDLTKPDCYQHPSVFRDDENLCRRRDQWNRLLGIHLTYAFGDNYEDIDRAFLAPYITDDGENVTLATDWIPDLVYSWGAKYDTFGVSRYFRTTDGQDIVVPGGDYGWCINKDETIAALKDQIERAESGVKTVVWLYSAMGWDNGDLTGTYVEVSLARQKLWCYRDYELVVSTDIVTGQPGGDSETVRGVFAVDAKKSPAVLGSMDVQGYASPVSYWCPFNGGQGLHDAPWRGAFGGNIYLTNGSHGCVNIPVDKMEAIYNTVSIGTAVVVY